MVWLFVTARASFISERGRIFIYKLIKFFSRSQIILTDLVGLFFFNLIFFVRFWVDLFRLVWLRLISWWISLRSVYYSLLLWRVAFYTVNKADLLWLFFLKKKNQLFSYSVPIVYELPVFFI